jgi:hypothetical protein
MDSFDFQVNALQGAPPQQWSAGTLQLEFQGGMATGTFQIGEYADPFPVTGTVAFDIMNGARVYVTGKNASASVEISGVQMTNNYGTTIAYFGGILNLLDYEVQEWLPYLLNGYQQVD